MGVCFRVAMNDSAGWRASSGIRHRADPDESREGHRLTAGDNKGLATETLVRRRQRDGEIVPCHGSTKEYPIDTSLLRVRADFLLRKRLLRRGNEENRFLVQHGRGQRPSAARSKECPRAEAIEHVINTGNRLTRRLRFRDQFR